MTRHKSRRRICHASSSLGRRRCTRSLLATGITVSCRGQSHPFTSRRGTHPHRFQYYHACLTMEYKTTRQVSVATLTCLVVLYFTSLISSVSPSPSTPPFESFPKSSCSAYPQTRSHEDNYKVPSPFSRVPGYHVLVDQKGYSQERE